MVGVGTKHTGTLRSIVVPLVSEPWYTITTLDRMYLEIKRLHTPPFE
ncbi:uncharacterized protein PgNI_00794 [Pyricularia grisea]|uniref:Uncharacterized protein n=1 Tax=Pyricularia grisea TaxID=148305 RepID=A0A6P8BFM4_PYRGI|nr:uncharacterized protein PgNI_00794 [Pyricularia grisea]TLD15520.1 hypothetical protein PgNI_00794 [Pyricularia grisea]